MPLITVRSRFQVTIPAKLRRGLDLREGDVMEATAVGDGILLRPRDSTDRGAAADRVATILKGIEPTAEDARRSEAQVMAAAVEDVAEARGARPALGPPGLS